MAKPKPIWSHKRSSLYLGDCIEIMNSLEAESVDMIFADPPYNLSNGGFSVHSGKRVSVNKGEWDVSRGVQEDFNFHYAWLESARRLLKPNGTIWVSGTYHSIYACGYAINSLGFRVLNDIAWYKPNASPNLSGRMFAASHESIIWASKSTRSKHVFNYSEMKMSEFSTDRLKNPEKQMRSVWSIPTTKKSEKIFGKHPTQKPELLLDRIVRASTIEGQKVLDPFCGSATTGVIARRLGRTFVGIDSDANYLTEIAIPRMQAG